MIVAVSPNISYDRLVVVRGFRPGHTSRALQIFTHAGGSAVHGAHVIRRMGGESIALGLVGGCTGMLWHKTAERLGIPNDMVEIEGESRVSYCVVDPELGCVVESVEPGPPTDPAALDELLEAGQHGGLVEVHCENEWMIERKIKRLAEEGRLLSGLSPDGTVLEGEGADFES